MLESATTSTTIDLLWVVIIGTGALLALAVSLIASLYISQRRYVAAQQEKMMALQESESRFRNLVENINDIYYICSADGNIVYGSPNLFSRSGYTEHEVLGTSYIRLIAREDRRGVVNHYLQRIADGTLDTTYEFRARQKNGNTVWVEQTTRILRNEAGDVTGFRNVVRDITERKRSGRILAEQERFLRTIIDVTPECVKLLDADGNLISMNPAGLAMIEADSLEQVSGKPVDQLITPPHRKQFTALTRAVFEGNDGTLEFEIIGMKGTRRWLETHAVPLYNERGNVAALLGITRDTTERRKAEEIRRNLTKRIIEAQESERKRIAFELHDSIAQLLSSIKFRLRDALEKSASPYGNRDMMIEIDSLLEKTIQEIRRVSQNLRPSVLDDLGLPSAVRSMCEEFTQRTAIQVELFIPETLNRFTPEVELALFRIIQETLTNVEKHSGATSLSVIFEQYNSSFRVSVRDNGKGFNPDLLREKPYKMRGIGLESIRERAASVGASVDIASSVGTGAEIIIRIPVNGASNTNILLQESHSLEDNTQ